MVRVNSAVSRKRRKQRVLKSAKGQFGQRSRRYLQAKRSVVKGQTYAYRDRKVKKREYRALWIVRINAACREAGVSYSRFIKGLSNAEVKIDRKMLAELAVSSPAAFAQLVKIASEAPAVKAKAKTVSKKKMTAEAVA